MMKHHGCLLVSAALGLLFSDGGHALVAADSIPSGDQPKLIFKTGFGGDTAVVYEGSQGKIIGRDPSPPDKSEVAKELGIPRFGIEHTGGALSQRFARIIPEPGNPKNKVLQFWLADSWKADGGNMKARVQADLYEVRPGYAEFYQSVRVYFHKSFRELREYPQPIYWLTIAEFWNDAYWGGNKYPFRISFGVGKPAAETSDLNFIVEAQSRFRNWLWEPLNTAVKVPIGEWFTLDYYYKQGDAQTGRFYAALTTHDGIRKVIFDVAGPTQNPDDPAPDGVTDWNPLKLYTSAEVLNFMKSRKKALEIYWDDFELWTNRRPTDSTPTPPPPVTAPTH